MLFSKRGRKVSAAPCFIKQNCQEEDKPVIIILHLVISALDGSSVIYSGSYTIKTQTDGAEVSKESNKEMMRALKMGPVRKG